MLPELSRRGGSTRAIRVASGREAEKELALAPSASAPASSASASRTIRRRCAQIDGAPPLLASRATLGRRTARRSASSARATPRSAVRNFAAMIARDIGRAGYTIISGLARGIDTAAHRASLDTGTIAALAGGLDQPYPPENIGLLDEITDGNGLAISEMPFGWEPRARDFPTPQPPDRRRQPRACRGRGGLPLRLADHGALCRRFRPAGLCRARLAARSALPGHQWPSEGRGDRDDGRRRTSSRRWRRSAASICSRRRRQRSRANDDAEPMSPPPDESDRARIVDALGPTPVEIDDIIRHTGLSASAVYLVLLELDLAGRLHRHAGGLVSLAIGE